MNVHDGLRIFLVVLLQRETAIISTQGSDEDNYCEDGNDDN